MRVKISVVQYATSIIGDTWKQNTGSFRTLSPTQPRNHKGHEITNVLELGDNRGLQPNNERTNTLYESQRCDEVAEVEYVRHKHPERR